MKTILVAAFMSALCVAALAQPKPPEPPKASEPLRAGDQRVPPAAPPANSARPQITAPPTTGPGAAMGAGQPAGARPAATAPVAATPANPAAAAAGAQPSTVSQTLLWEGRWSGTFGARTDMTITVSGGRVTAVTLLGQPMTITTSTVTAMAASASGPEFRIDLARFTATAGQGIYENARREKAIAAFQKM
jgi:cytoskeletal protein RodZ